jgi:hypothetical protein
MRHLNRQRHDTPAPLISATRAHVGMTDEMTAFHMSFDPSQPSSIRHPIRHGNFENALVSKE